jgi:hypothetical protein
MKRLSKDEYDPDQDPTTTAEEGEGVQAEGDGSATVHTTRPSGAPPEETPSGEGDDGRLLPDGLNAIEGEIPDGMMAAGGTDEGEGGEEATGQQNGEPSPDATGEDTEGSSSNEDETGSTSESEQESEEMDDVPSSPGWLDDVTAQTGLEAESEDEFVEQVRTMHRDVRGFSELEEVLEQVPQAATLIHSLAQTEGEIDPVDFYMAAQDVEGLDVQAPSKAENPDEYADFKARLRERQQKMRDRREQQEEQQKKAKQVREDFEQAFESFKQRKDLGDEEARAFKQEFARVFYGDAEKGELPRMDVFDLAWDALREQKAGDTPTEETDEYKEGYNQAIEDMKEGGADGLPDLKNAGGTGSEDGGDAGSGPAMPALLEPSGDGGMNHDAF